MSSSRSSTVKALSRGRARLALLALCLLGGAQGAWALCTVTPGYVEKVVNMDMGNVLIPNGTGVSATPFIKQFFALPLTGNDKPWTCSNGGTVNGDMLQGTPVAGYDHVFTTAVPGVGIRLSRYFDANTVAYYPHTNSTTSDFGNFDAASKFQVELFKIAPVTGNGPLAQGIYTHYYSLVDGKSVLTSILSGVGITIITPSCTVDMGSRNILVEFGKVPLNSFSGTGKPAANYDRNFNITLNCSAGANTHNMVYLRMDATQDPSNQPGVLQITQGGTNVAGGVGIQILDDKSAPMAFGADALVGQSKDGSYVLPYTARYFQTGNQVTPGRADGTATFTLDYK